MILETGFMGLALSNSCAIEICDETFRILKSVDKAYALRLYKTKDGFVKEELATSVEYK